MLEIPTMVEGIDRIAGHGSTERCRNTALSISLKRSLLLALTARQRAEFDFEESESR